MKQIIIKIASWFGLQVQSDYGFHQQKRYAEILEELLMLSNVQQTKDCQVVIFSKDRACQLDALIKSYFHFVQNPVAITVLYAASNEDFLQGYDKLIDLNLEQNVSFVKEENFKQDLRHIFRQIETKNVMFLVDDIIFKNSIDFNLLSSIDTTTSVFSLRHGNHLNHSYTTKQNQALPNFRVAKDINGMLAWDWNKAELDWAYPLSVDGHLFDTNLMRVLVDGLDYKAPNSFEQALQIMMPLFMKKIGICMEESIIVNIPCNKVQTENNNHAGQLSAEEVNQMWLDDQSIDFLQLSGVKNASAHQELQLHFIKSASK